MIFVINEFKSRVKEIDLYFNFVKNFDLNNTILYHTQKKSYKKEKINPDLYKVLKANLFLLLYNAVESSFKDALEKLCDDLSESNIMYKNVKNELKELYLQKKYYLFDGNKASGHEKKSTWLVDTIKDLSNDIIEIKFDKKNEISGNLNATEIKKIAKTYGFMSDKITQLDGQKTHIVKNQRNSLAHGSTSFAECGKNYTIQELMEIKDGTIKYMTNILNIIKKYIKKQNY